MLARDDLVYIYRREDEADAAGDADKAEDGDEATVTVEKIENIEEKHIESAAEALALEIARDLEIMMGLVREDRNVLGRALDMLREEYLNRDPAELAGIRDALRNLFDAGNREMDAVNRILDQMRTQTAEYRKAPPDLRDGMLIENLRELIDSATRRSGETGALTEALNTVATLLREKRQSGLPVPDSVEFMEVFTRTYDQSMANWHARSGLNDPMGKELAERLQGVTVY